jgi:dethiobiotin synthetase
MTRSVFITGTDTGVGKTWVSLGVITALQRHGLRTAAMKPVASGARRTPEGPRNDDALMLQDAADVDLIHEQVNPVLFTPPVAPHIAARRAGVTIDIDSLVVAHRRMAARCDWVVVEGIGGWRVPLSGGQTTADLVKALELPVIVVVGMRLGCLNHALLTRDAILNDGLRLLGWVANRVDAEMACVEENIATLDERMGVPRIGVVPHLRHCDRHAVAACLDIDVVIREN